MAVPKYIPHYNHADYEQWDGDWELWNGIAVAMTPSPFGPHQKLIARLTQTFMNALDQQNCDQQNCGDCDVVVELDWIVSDDTVVRPDLSIVCEQTLERFIDKPPVLIVEVLSESTRIKDRTTKYKLFEQQGVKYYILADPIDIRYIGFELRDKAYTPLPLGTKSVLELHQSCIIEVNLPTEH